MRDLSQGGDGDALDVDLVRDQTGKAYEIVTAAAFEANEVGREDGFPEFGTFIKCRSSRDEDVWVELPQDLENELAKKGEEVEADGDTLEGLVFRVAGCRKTADGTWRYQLEWFDSFEAASDSLSA